MQLTNLDINIITIILAFVHLVIADPPANVQCPQAQAQTANAIK